MVQNFQNRGETDNAAGAELISAGDQNKVKRSRSKQTRGCDTGEM